MEDEQSEGAPPRRERRDARANREQILATAKELFAAQGADATSMQEIARVAGVGQGTLYRHFAHKGELCHGLIKEDLALFEAQVGKLIGGPDAPASPLERLELLIVEKTHLTESHLPLFAAMGEQGAGMRRDKIFYGPFSLWVHEQISGLLAEAVAQGEVADLDIPFAADAMLAVMAPPLYRYQREERGYSSERIIAGMRRLFLDGLRLRAEDSTHHPHIVP